MALLFRLFFVFPFTLQEEGATVDPLVKHLSQVNRRYHFWEREDTLLLAVSGGADSMALLAAMSALPASVRPRLRVLHVNHHLRPESKEEADLTARICSASGIPCVLKDWRQSEHPTSGLEAAARLVRYQFFLEEMAATKAKFLVTAHHGDDQMETILMRLTRGSTLEGAAGIKMSRPFGTGHIIRPFLGVEKQELYDFCFRNQVEFREDSSNVDPAFTRNRYRHEVLPFLKQENPQANVHFQQFSEDLLALWETAAPLIESLVASCFVFTNGCWQLDIPAIQKQSLGKRRLMVSHFLQEVWGAPKGTFQRSHTDDILDLIAGRQPQAVLHFPGERLVQRNYGKVCFYTGESDVFDRQEGAIFSLPAKLGLNQWLELPFNGKMGLFSYETGKGLLEQVEYDEAIFLAGQTRLPLVIRHPQPGDRIRMNPAAPFTKKLARLFIDRKLPNTVREKTLVVQDDAEEILWVPGHARSVCVQQALKETVSGSQLHDGYLLIYKKNDEVKV